MSYGSEQDDLDIATRRDPLEAIGAMLLGRLLMGWSRIDMAVQLYAAALLPPDERDPARNTFHEQLECILDFADTLPDKALRSEFVRWIVRARELEPLAASLRDGRWLPDPRRNVLLQLGRPGSPAPGRTSFTVGELEEALAAQAELFADLHRLCALERGMSQARAAAFLTTQPIDVVTPPQ